MLASFVALSLALAAAALPAHAPHDPLVTTSILRRTSGTKKNRTSTWAHNQAASLRNKYNVATPLARRQKQSGVGATELVNVNADSSYIAPLLIGSPGQSFNVILDTGSSDLWLAGNACATCSDVPRFDQSSSSSFRSTDTPFSIQYGSGAAKGVMASDVVQMNNFQVPNQAFAITSKVTANLLDNDTSGLLGLGFGSIASSGTTPFVQTLFQQGALNEPLFSFFLTRFIDVLETGDQIMQFGGEFMLGGTNKALYDGDIDFVDIPAGLEGFWQIPMTTLLVNGIEIPVPAAEAGSAIDSGTTLFGGPPDLIAAIYSQVPGAVPASSLGNGLDGYWAYPCNATFSVSVAFGPKGEHTLHTVDPADIELMRISRNACIGAFFEIELGTSPQNPAWIVGDTFMKSVYSVFRFDPPSVGFAKLSDAAKALNGVRGQPLPTATSVVNPIRATATSVPGDNNLNAHMKSGSNSSPKTVASSLFAVIFALCIGAFVS